MYCRAETFLRQDVISSPIDGPRARALRGRLGAEGGLLAGQVVLDVEQAAGARAADDGEERRHRVDLLELLGDEPVEEAQGDVVRLLAGDVHQAVDLLGDVLLPIEREAHGLLRRRELALRSRHVGDLDDPLDVVDEVDELQGVLPLLGGLAEEEAGELRQVLAVEVAADGDVLVGRAQLVAGLDVEGGDQLVTGEHQISSSILVADW